MQRTGRLIHRVSEFLLGECVCHRSDFDIFTKEIVRGVWGDDAEVTRSRRVSVLRVMKTRFPDGWVEGSGSWRIMRGRARRGWVFICPPSAEYGQQTDYTPRPREGGRIASAIRLMDASIEDEQVAAMLGATRLLTAQKLTWADVAGALDGWR